MEGSRSFVLGYKSDGGISEREKSHRVKRRKKGCNKAENEERHKRMRTQGGQPITGFGVAFKDAWDRWLLETISHHRAASSQEEIRDSSIQAPSSHSSCRRSYSHSLCLS